MAEMIDFTNCKRIFGRAFNGANGKKIAIEYDGRQYMLKFPPSAKSIPNVQSYSNSCLSEHIGSSIFNMLEVTAQNTLLGTFTVDGKEKIVCACEDFTADGKSFYDFCSIKNTVIDSGHGGTGTELDDLSETIEKQQFVNPTELIKHFWDMFIIDALLGNFDRHNGNWGFLVDRVNQTAEIAPVFDCGSCLLPQADENIMQNVLQNEDEMNARIFRFPQSEIKENGKKINYYDFLMSAENEDCNEALQRIYPRINIAQISGFIENIPCLSELQRDFYTRYINTRYERILSPAYENIMEQDNGPTQSM